MSSSQVRIAVDAVGGDDAPAPVLAGVDLALAADPDLIVLLFGPAGVVEPFAASRARVEARVTTEIIEMGEHAATSVRSKKDSSIVAGCASVRDRAADGFFSAGNTGAVMAAATLVMGRSEGVSRPAIATIMPTTAEPVVLLDAGANADCKPDNLREFAHMGAAYARIVLGRPNPTIGLLNIGSEPTKGSQLATESHELLRDHVPGFAGNVEGGDIPFGTTDVVVTDGFTGNVVLKLMEGLADALLGQVKESITAGPIDRFAAAILKPRLAGLKARLDPELVGGAPLLGVDGVCIIGHGGSGSGAVAAAIDVASRAVRGGLVSAIAEAVGEHSEQSDSREPRVLTRP